jgi:flagellar motor switch protein FliN/FliY
MTETLGTATPQQYAEAAAAAVARALPAVQPLTPAAAQPGTPHVISAFAGAAVVDLTGPVPGRVGLLVAADLVQALESSPLQGLDLGAATQPALDAAAAALGGTASAARTVDLALAVAELGEPFTAVPLVGAGIAAAVLLPDATLAAAATAPRIDPPSDQLTEQPIDPPVPTVSAPTGTAPTAAAPAAPVTPIRRDIQMLHGVVMDVTVEIGRTRMSVRDLLALAPGTVLELDRAAGSPADLLVNGRLIARGEVVVVDEDFGLRVTEIVDDSAVG